MLHRLVRIVKQAWSLSHVRRKERKKASPFTRGSSSFPREKCSPTKTHKNNACFTSYTNIFHQGQDSRGIYQNLLSLNTWETPSDSLNIIFLHQQHPVLFVWFPRHHPRYTHQQTQPSERAKNKLRGGKLVSITTRWLTLQ